ncbi:MAG: YciI family protein [Bryobacteraceae bacterium]
MAASADPPWPPPGTECGESVLAHYAEGPNFATAAQVFPEHAKYIGELLRQGKFVAAGRMKDANRALILIRTNDLAEAQTWVNEDPFVKNGVVKATLEVWGHCWAVGVPAPDFAPAKAK